jgi:hypothetical protein
VLEKVWPSCRVQRFGVRQAVPIVDKLPKKPPVEAKEKRHDI